jgi:4-hydroxy-3-polyprenylbenzoate decarboxylase
MPATKSSSSASAEIILGVSGGSGSVVARRFAQTLVASGGLARLHLVVSDAALRVARTEIDAAIDSPAAFLSALALPRAAVRRVVLHDNGDVGASIASGSYPAAGMAVVPCSGGTLGSIAHGIARDLLQRAADVCLKERRPLVLAVRETPYSLVHIENMRLATLAGAVIAPPLPAFYIDDPSPERFLDAWCARTARRLGLSPPGDGFVWRGGGVRPSARRPPRRGR